MALTGIFTNAPISTPVGAKATPSAIYGIDIHCVTDTDKVDQLVTAPWQVIGERIARRWQTPRGALAIINDDPGGWDVRQYLNGKMGPRECATAQAALEAEALKDEEVQSADVSVTLSAGVLSVSGALVSTAGPFTLVLTIDQVSASVVFSS